MGKDEAYAWSCKKTERKRRKELTYLPCNNIENVYSLSLKTGSINYIYKVRCLFIGTAYN